MAVITVDFETHYSQDYSLSRMSEVAYVLDDRFQTIMAAIKVDGEKPELAVGDDAVARRFAEIDWANSALLSHNVRFDGAILCWRYGYVPKLYLDTLSMCRATTHWTLGRSSLAKVAGYLGLPAKGDEVVRAKGKRLEDFDEAELKAYASYCKHDANLAYQIFQRLRPAFKASELYLIDLVARMFVLPQVRLNTEVLEENYDRVQKEKAIAVAAVAEIDPKALASNQQFAELLRLQGVELPMKTSPSTGKSIPALAKGDPGFKALCQDETQPLYVQALLGARTAVKSTLEETRSRNLLELSRRHWPGNGRGWAPISLKYSGARTHRLSGDGGLNWQNLPRGSLLRTAIEAPPGWRIVHRDQSQIEARMTAWMARCDVLLDAFAEGRDVYSEFASQIYQRQVSKADTLERFVGKTAILGLGYGCGPERFQQMLFIGNGGISVNVEIAKAQDIVWQYRDTYPEIPALWSHAGTLLWEIVSFGGKTGRRRRFRNNWSHIPVEPDFDSFLLPNDLRICYPNMRQQEKPSSTGGSIEIVYDDPYQKDPKKIYGAKAVENISQALSRIIVTDTALRVQQLSGYRPFLSTHDSLDYVVPASDAAALDAELEYQFAIVPVWGEGLPLASEGGWGRNLTAAEKRENS